MGPYAYIALGQVTGGKKRASKGVQVPRKYVRITGSGWLRHSYRVYWAIRYHLCLAMCMKPLIMCMHPIPPL